MKISTKHWRYKWHSGHKLWISKCGWILSFRSCDSILRLEESIENELKEFILDKVYILKLSNVNNPDAITIDEIMRSGIPLGERISFPEFKEILNSSLPEVLVRAKLGQL